MTDDEQAHDGVFDATVAAVYDSSGSDEFDPEFIERTVDFLEGFVAEDRTALELAIGTGRVALPLAARGVRVHGIDMSRAMVTRMREKPGGEAIGVTFGDFATVRAASEPSGSFELAYLVYNTIMNLTSQDAQVECFRNAASHLKPGGHFVIEVMIPELRKLPPGQAAVPQPNGLSPTRAAADYYDTATQFCSSNYYDVVDGVGSVRIYPFRYVWPSELDLMARLAGMTLVERWAGWEHEPFEHESTKHISVWRKNP